MSTSSRPSTPKSVLHCAIYTRKSSEEGLEQHFNSLDAQREACEAYIQSQRSEGWRLVPDHYDDGGYSGATLHRPGLQRLLAEVAAGGVQIVVVYKIDRLTRSLADFAKIVETFDHRGASFVSITQQFNTTTSMGRLTLNVLLSFAQFEREVTGERIRDKIAASKRKGLWMGGRVPLGYQLEQGKLIVEEGEAQLVRHIFESFLRLGTVNKLQEELERDGVRSKLRVNETGESAGGCTYSRGALYRILANPLYIGEIRSGKQRFPGEQQAIISGVMWREVQEQLERRRQMRRTRPGLTSCATLLGCLEDEHGQRFVARRSRKNNRQYTYYALAACKGNEAGRQRQKLSLPAYPLEQLVCSTMRGFLHAPAEVLDRLGTANDPAEVTQALALAIPTLADCWSEGGSTNPGQLLQQISARVVVKRTRIEVLFSRTAMRRVLLADSGHPQHEAQAALAAGDDLCRLEVNAKLKRLGAEVRLIIPAKGAIEEDPHRLDPVLKAVARGRRFYDALVSGEAWSVRSLAALEGVTARYAGRMLEAGFLAPDLIAPLLDGQRVEGLTLDRLRRRLSPSWMEQREQLRLVTASALRLTHSRAVGKLKSSARA